MKRVEESTLLTESEIADALMELPDWELKGKQIVKTYEFKTFAEGIDFVTRVAAAADEVDHHPDIHIKFRKVQLVLWTHRLNGVTKLDTMLAKRCERLFEET